LKPRIKDSTRYMDSNNWGEIERGWVFEAAMLYSPSDTYRPLSFFRPDEDNPDRGSIVYEFGDFAPKKDPVTGEYQQEENRSVVIGIKPRKVIVLSNNIINHSKEWKYIMVAPMFRTYEYESFFDDVISGRHPYFAYFPKVEHGTTLHRHVDVSQTISIHKGVLLERKEKVPELTMELIEELLIENMSLGSIE